MNRRFALLAAVPVVCWAEHPVVHERWPTDFVDISTVAPEIQKDLRYFSRHGFVGRRIAGYDAPICLLTKPAELALRAVQFRLLPTGTDAKGLRLLPTTACCR